MPDGYLLGEAALRDFRQLVQRGRNHAARPRDDGYRTVPGGGAAGGETEIFCGIVQADFTAADPTFSIKIIFSSTGRYAVDEVIEVDNIPKGAAYFFDGKQDGIAKGHLVPASALPEEARERARAIWVECPPQDAAAAPAAAGSDQAGATELAAEWSAVSGADGTKGVKMFAPSSAATTIARVYNNSASGLKLYPHSGGDFNDGTTNASITVPAKTLVTLINVDGTTWATDS